MADTVPIGLQTTPLSMPAILHNPRSKAQIQIEAYTAQQRESREAKRAASSASHDEFNMRRKGEGKRALRRRENATMVFNPHKRMPTLGDYTPMGNNGDKAASSSFVLPGGTPKEIRSANVPSPALPASEPVSTAAGQFTLSLKGVRQLLRKRGRRAEVVVGICEKEMREWVLGPGAGMGEAGSGFAANGATAGTGYGQPKVIDSTSVDYESSSSAAGSSSAIHGPLAELTPALEDLETGSTRSLPAMFSTSPASSPEHLSIVLHSFCTSGTSTSNFADPTTNTPFANPTNRPKPTANAHARRKRPAIVELVHSPGHLVWAVADSFERLVVHLLCRYYELISFSQTLPPLSQSDGTRTPAYRITHILKPSHVNPTQPAAFDLMTPENTDLDTDTAGGTASESEVAGQAGFLTASESEDESLDSANRGRAEPGVVRPGQMMRNPSVDSDWSRVETESAADSDSGFSVDEVVWRPSSTQMGETSFASTIMPAHAGIRTISTASSVSGQSDFEDDGDADASDMDSVAGSSLMMDSLIIGTGPDRAASGAGVGGWTNITSQDQPFIASSMPEANGFLSMSMEQRRMSLGSNAPFVSEFNLPVDLFPARRMGLGQSKDKVEKPSFFEYLYG